MISIYDFFIMILAILAFFSFLFGSIYTLTLVLWFDCRLPQGLSVSLAIFSVSLLGLAYKDSGPPILILFTIASMCWILIATHQSLILHPPIENTKN